MLLLLCDRILLMLGKGHGVTAHFVSGVAFAWRGQERCGVEGLLTPNLTLSLPEIDEAQRNGATM